MRQAHVGLLFASVALARFVFESALYGYAVTISLMVAHGLLAYTIVTASGGAQRRMLAAQVAGGFALVVLLPPPLMRVGWAVLPLGLSESGGDLLNGLAIAAPFVGFAALGNRFLAPGVGPGADLPEPLRESGEALRAFVTWSRVRSIALVTVVGLSVASVLGRSGGEGLRGVLIPLALVALGSGPLLLHALVRLRRTPEGSDVRGPATVALVLLVIHGICDAPWILFSFVASRGSLSSGDMAPLPFMAVLTVLTACLVDSAVALAAVRLGRALEVVVPAGAIHALIWASSFGGWFLAGGVLFVVGADNELFTFAVGTIVLAVGLGGNALAQQHMLRATRLG